MDVALSRSTSVCRILSKATLNRWTAELRDRAGGAQVAVAGRDEGGVDEGGDSDNCRWPPGAWPWIRTTDGGRSGTSDGGVVEGSHNWRWLAGMRWRRVQKLIRA